MFALTVSYTVMTYIRPWRVDSSHSSN
uniref:Uncharacterized protein n=1 Tax=Arundo donax TaxID=35708 RepID=A0A0A8Y824_ARUDO